MIQSRIATAYNGACSRQVSLCQVKVAIVSWIIFLLFVFFFKMFLAGVRVSLYTGRPMRTVSGLGRASQEPALATIQVLHHCQHVAAGIIIMINVTGFAITRHVRKK